MPPNHNLSVCRPTQTHEKIRDSRCLYIHPMNQPFRNRRRRLQRLMRHQIQNRDIPRVTDAGQYRQLELRTNGAKLIIIETRQIRCGTSAPDEYNGIKRTLILFGDLFQRRNNGLRRSVALHGRTEKGGLEPVRTMLQLVFEIFITRCRRR